MSYDGTVKVEDYRTGNTLKVNEDGSICAEVTAMPSSTTVEGVVAVSSVSDTVDVEVQGCVCAITPSTEPPAVGGHTIGATSVEIIAADSDTKFVEIHNASAAVIYINFGGAASVTDYPLPSNTTWRSGPYVPIHSITAIGSTTGQSVFTITGV